MRSIFDELNAARAGCLVLVDNRSDLRNGVNDIFDRLFAACKALCDASDAKYTEERKLLQVCTREQYQDHIDDLTVELAACKEAAAADRQTIQHLVAVVNKLVK